MSQNYYNLYIDSVLDLAQTIVIKSEESATAINNYLTMVYGESIVDVNRPETWKYYQNICGQYHSTDTEITVTSLDTLEKITFSTDNLKVHKATNAAYQYGTRQYIELLSLYPDKEQLILGILYPADMDFALSASDGTILSYPPYLVESNEITLIEKLNRVIEVYNIRWHNPQFGLSDSLYSAAHMGLLYLHLVPSILNIRLAACKTSEAHSFHVRQYLASHGMLDVYLDKLTLKQALFFYRNIAYIERNSGKREVFSWLLEHIMTERNLPLGEYTMKHNESGMLDNLYPTITFKKKSLNFFVNQPVRDSYTLKEILDKEQYLSPGNVDYRGEHEKAIQNKIEYSLSSVLATKMLESSVIDYTDATPYTMQSILLNEWLDLSSRDIYNVYVSVKNPRTGEGINLIAKDAFIYMMYVFARAIGSNIDKIPSFIALRAQCIPAPTINELMGIVDNKYIDSNIAREIISGQPDIPPDKPIVSIQAFFNLSKSIFNACQNQITIMGRQQHYYRRALVYNMVCRMYSDNVIHFPNEGMLFSEWLTLNNLPSTEFTMNENLELYKNLYEAATGSLLNNTDTLASLQNAMLNLFKQLSSYSVQFMSELNTSNIRVLNWGVIRLGDQNYQQSMDQFIPDILNDVIQVKATLNQSGKYNLSNPAIQMTEKVKLTNRYNIGIAVKPSIDRSEFAVEKLYLQTSKVTINLSGNYDNYSTISGSDTNLLKDIYTH